MKRIDIKNGFMLICDDINEPAIINVDKITEIIPVAVGDAVAIVVHDHNAGDRIVVNFKLLEFWGYIATIK